MPRKSSSLRPRSTGGGSATAGPRIRAFNPFPVCFSTLGEKRVKIWQATAAGQRAASVHPAPFAGRRRGHRGQLWRRPAAAPAPATARRKTPDRRAASQRATANSSRWAIVSTHPQRARLMALDPRAAAAQVIGDVLAGRSLNQALPPRLAQGAASATAACCSNCVTAPCGKRPGCRPAGQLLDKPLKDKDRDLQGLLLCGLYQLESTRIPDHAAVSSTVAAVRRAEEKLGQGHDQRSAAPLSSVSARLWQHNCRCAAAACHPDWLYHTLQQQWPAAAPARSSLPIICSHP